MKIMTFPVRPTGTITAPFSKSHLIRLLLAAMLSTEKTVIEGVSEASDVLSAIECIRALGCICEITDGMTIVTPPKGFPVSVKLYVGESASLLRFLMPICLVLNIKTTYVLQGTLISRPIAPFTALLSEKGAQIVCRDNEITVEGELKSGKFSFCNPISSQLASGLLMALPLLNGSSTIHYEGNDGYVLYTREVMASFGIDISYSMGSFEIFGKQSYNTSGSYQVEGDWSSAANFLVAGALLGDITVKNLNPLSLQPDVKILKILAKSGVLTIVEGNEVTVRASEIQAANFCLDCSPDIIPITALLLSGAKGVSVIKGMTRLRYKESDRIEAIIQTLTKVGARVSYDDLQGLSVSKGELHPASLMGYSDHRIIMLSAIIGYMVEISVDNVECVGKSYPEFFRDYQLLGGKINVID